MTAGPGPGTSPAAHPSSGRPNTTDSLEALRAQPFYCGQILRVRMIEGAPAEVGSIETLFAQVPRLATGSLARILRGLGFGELYAAHLGALARAFPEQKDEPEDAVLIAPFSAVREAFWQLVCLAEVLDEGRRCIVLCPDAAQAGAAAEATRETMRRADIVYAAEVAVVTEPSGLAVFNDTAPAITVLTPEMLRTLLRNPAHASAREVVLSALGRVVFPGMDSWPPALATHTAYLLREVQLECALRGVSPAMAATSAPALEMERFASELWGRHLDGRAFVRTDSVEASPLQVVNYTGGLVRDPVDATRWIRQDPVQVASDLLQWLVDRLTRPPAGLELHYVLDISGSMAGILPAVRKAVLRDLDLKLAAGSLKDADRVKLTVFDTSATEVFAMDVAPGLRDALDAALAAQAPRGGTDIPVGLGTALESAIKGGAGSVHVILFSDGESLVTAVQRSELLALTRRAHSLGTLIRVLYVVLDMEPPASTRNLILAMGGKVIRSSAEGLERMDGFDTENRREGCVIFLSGEKGLPDDVLQPAQTGRRRVIFTRDLTRVHVAPDDVAAVVVSGRFRSLREIRNQVMHLGRECLPVFVLAETEAWSQLLVEDYPEAAPFEPALLIRTENPGICRMRLLEWVGDREVDAELFRYLRFGMAAHGRLMKHLRHAGARGQSLVTTPPPPLAESELPADFEMLARNGRWLVRRAEGPLGTSTTGPFPLDCFTEDYVELEGEGILVSRDRASSPLVCHGGAIVDSGNKSAEVGALKENHLQLRRRSRDRYASLVENAHVEALDVPAWNATSRKFENLGELGHGTVRFSGRVSGLRRFPLANLDDRSMDERYADAFEIQFNTEGMRWNPEGVASENLAGLANLVRLALFSMLRHLDETLLVFPDSDGNAIWFVDLGAGGNGASALMAGDDRLLRSLLALGGRLTLDCPCEGGLSGASDADASRVGLKDTGCPRCTRLIGPVITPRSSGALDSGTVSSKKATLEWLIARGHLPTAAARHVEEKYAGVQDPARVIGPDIGSRRACIPLVRRILADRLGLELPDSDVASFQWLAPNTNGVLGVYAPGPNTLAILQGLVEWLSFDICAHEFFHNLQARLPGLFDASLGSSGAPPPPFAGKLFIEGSAMWAESHVLDALVIRSSLNAANLRQGDEYGVGFQLMKFIEERYGGIGAVLKFLGTGDIELATGGRIRDLTQLYSLVGVPMSSATPTP